MAEGHVAADGAPPTATDNSGAAVSGSGRSSGTVGRGSGQTLPLNSRRLTASLLRQLAAGSLYCLTRRFTRGEAVRRRP